ncbi:MAG: FkbM family methyltransferase [Candidatus Marinimicrobia bacterium]|nr:FkbM family methyltransferase [Candidatus Neomarinimicrobiota bacterium]
MLGRIAYSVAKKFGYRIEKRVSNEEKLVRIIRYLLAEVTQPVIFDVGANIGQSIDIFREAHGGAIIHSFEPSPSSFQKLQQEYGSSPRITLNNLALGDSEGQAVLYQQPFSKLDSLLRIDYEIWQKLSIRQSQPLDEDAFNREVPIQLTTVDRYCDTNTIDHVDLLKMDVQGTEDRVLAGAAKMLPHIAQGGGQA